MIRCNVFAWLVPAALLLTSTAALAQSMGPPPGGPGAGPGGPGGGEAGQYVMLLRNLSLSDAQQASVRQLMDSQRTQIGALQEQLHTAHASLTARLYETNGTVAITDLAADQAQMAQLMNQLKTAELQTVLQIRTLLTADQRSKLADLQARLESLHSQTEELLKPVVPSAVR